MPRRTKLPKLSGAWIRANLGPRARPWDNYHTPRNYEGPDQPHEGPAIPACETLSLDLESLPTLTPFYKQTDDHVPWDQVDTYPQATRDLYRLAFSTRNPGKNFRYLSNHRARLYGSTTGGSAPKELTK